jgi:hypothetical protein
MNKANRIRSLFSAGLLFMSVTVINTAYGFEPGNNVEVGDYPSSVTKGDFNGDNKQDLAATNFYDNAVSISLGNGDGSFPKSGQI